MDKQFFFEDGKWRRVPCDELGRPMCDYWRVAMPLDELNMAIHEYRPQLYCEDGVKFYIFRRV